MPALRQWLKIFGSLVPPFAGQVERMYRNYLETEEKKPIVIEVTGQVRIKIHNETGYSKSVKRQSISREPSLRPDQQFQRYRQSLTFFYLNEYNK